MIIIWYVFVLLSAKTVISMYCNLSDKDVMPYSKTAVDQKVLHEVIKISHWLSEGEERDLLKLEVSDTKLKHGSGMSTEQQRALW